MCTLLKKSILSLALFFALIISAQAQFNTIWRGPDTLFVEDNCKAYLWWENPTPENSLYVTSQLGGEVEVEIASITPVYMLKDSVPAGVRLRIRYEFSDRFGNSGFRNVILPVVDTEAPVFDPAGSPATIVVDCIAELGTPTVLAIDNCDEAVEYSFTQTAPPAVCAGGTIVRDWVARDGSGNEAMFTQTITVRPDTIAPDFAVMPRDTTVPCGAPAGLAFLAWLDRQRAAVQVTDRGCGLADFVVSHPDTADLIGACGPQEVLFTATDSCGNQREARAFFTIEDLEAPRLMKLARDTVVECTGPTAAGALAEWIALHGRATADDNCGELEWTTFPDTPSLADACNDTLELVFIARDGCGNQASTRAHFIFLDDTRPFFERAPADLTVRCDTASNVSELYDAWLESGGFAEARDHCSAVSFFAAVPGSYELDEPASWPGRLPEFPGDMSCATPDDPGAATMDVDFVYHDLCGNTTVQQRRFSLRDTIAPLLENCPQDQSLTADPVSCDAQYALAPPEAFDNCLSSSNRILRFWTELISSAVPGDTEVPVDTITVNIPAALVYNPGTLGDVHLKLDFFNLDANDPTEYFTVFDEDMSPLGQTSIQAVECVNFTDEFDNIDGADLERWMADQVVTVTLVPNIPAGMSTRFAINDKCGGSSVNATLTFDAGVAGDVLMDYRVDGGAFTPLDPGAPGSVRLAVGQHRVVYRAYDCQGNVDSCAVEVTVLDQAAPALNCPDDLTVSLDEGSCTVSRSVALPFGLSDQCSGIERLSIQISGATNIGPRDFNLPYTPQVFPFTRGESLITYTVRDSVGNQGLCTFNYTVEDNEAPEARCRSIAVMLDPSGLNDYVLSAEEIDAGSADNCADITLSIPPTEFSCNQSGEEIPVVLTVRDESGNEDSCTATVRVLVPALVPSYSVDICGDDTLKLFANTPPVMGSDPFTYQWTGPGGFTSNVRNPKRQGATASFSGLYQVLATGFNGCVSMGTVQVSINEFNTPTLVSDKQRYCSNEEILLEATSYSGTVEYEWYEGVPPGGVLIGRSASPNLLVTPTTGRHRYYVIVRGMSCTTNPSPVYQIDVDEALEAEVDAELIRVCEGGRIVLGTPTVGVNYTYRWTGPDGFTSDRQYPAAIEPADPAKHSGTYMLVVSNGSCNSEPVAVDVTVAQKPARPRIDVNSLACEGDTVTLFVTNVTQGERYIWTKPDGSETLRIGDNTLPVAAFPVNEGAWRVRVEIGGCASDLSDAFELDIEEALNFLVVNDGPVCEGDSVTLTAEVVPGASYRWSGPGNFRSTMRQVRTPAFGGLYTVELTTPNGCVSTAETRVELRPVPRITALSSSGDSTCVTGVECVQLTPTVFPADMGQYSYRWEGPGGFVSSASLPCVPNATEAINGVYSLVVSNGECESVAASTQVRVFEVPPVAELQGSQAYCVGDTLFLTAGVSNPGTAWRYRWKTPGSTRVTQDPTLKIDAVGAGDEGYYSLIIENGPCASAVSDSVFVEVTDQPDRPVILPLGEVCEGDAIRLEAVSNPSYRYTWLGPGGYRSEEVSPIIDPVALDNAGTYALRVQAGSCRSPLSIPVQLVVHERPATAAPVADTEAICLDDPQAVFTFCAQEGSTSDTASYTAVLLPTGSSLGMTTDLCLDIPATLLTEGNNRIAWVGDNNGCLSDTSTAISLRADRAPLEMANAGPDAAICDDEYILTAAIPGIGTGTWRSESGTINFSNPLDPGTEITGIDTGSHLLIWSLSHLSCLNYSSDSLVIHRDREALANDDSYSVTPGQNSQLPVLENDQLPLRLVFNIITPPTRGVASFNNNGLIEYEPNPQFFGTDSLQYRICPADCPDLCDETWVRIESGAADDCAVPTVLTPNGDNYNDMLIIPCLSSGQYPNNKISVFNVWGDEVFSAAPYLNDWDGSFKGNALPEGSYYYVFDAGNGDAVTAGFIIIQR